MLKLLYGYNTDLVYFILFSFRLGRCYPYKTWRVLRSARSSPLLSLSSALRCSF